jgi:hypothetical protein
MMIHARIQKSKQRKVPKAKQAEYDAWIKSVNSMSTSFSSKKVKPVQVVSPVVSKPFVRETKYYPSLDTGLGTATKAEPMKYTGDKIVGIATMHKSNAVPVFNDQQAKDISSMRR